MAMLMEKEQHPLQTAAKAFYSNPELESSYDSCSFVYAINCTLFPDELKKNLIDEVYTYQSLESVGPSALPAYTKYRAKILHRIVLLSEIASNLDGGEDDRVCLEMLAVQGWIFTARMRTTMKFGSAGSPPGDSASSDYFHEQMQRETREGQRKLDERDRKLGRVEGDSYLDEEAERARIVRQGERDEWDGDFGRAQGASYLSSGFTKILNFVLGTFWKKPIP